MGAKSINYIRNACLVGDELFFIVNENNALYSLSLKEERIVHKVSNLIALDSQWTLCEYKNLLYCISLIDAQVIVYDKLWAKQKLLVKLNNKKPFIDARLIEDKLYFIPWNLDDKTYVYCIQDGSMQVEQIDIDDGEDNQIYRWSFFKNLLLVVLKERPYFYEIDLDTRNVKKIYSHLFLQISDVIRDELNYYITTEKEGGVLEIQGVNTAESVFVEKHDREGYRKILSDGENLFLDADKEMDCFRADRKIITLPMMLRRKERGSNFFSVVKTDVEWIFIPWLSNKIVFLSASMSEYSQIELQLPSDEYIHASQMIYECDFELADFIEGVVGRE